MPSVPVTAKNVPLETRKSWTLLRAVSSAERAPCGSSLAGFPVVKRGSKNFAPCGSPVRTSRTSLWVASANATTSPLAFSALIAVCFLHPAKTSAISSVLKETASCVRGFGRDCVVKRRTFIFERRAYADARSAQIKIAELCDCNGGYAESRPWRSLTGPTTSLTENDACNRYFNIPSPHAPKSTRKSRRTPLRLRRQASPLRDEWAM